jgi:hypothetical protein
MEQEGKMKIYNLNRKLRRKLIKFSLTPEIAAERIKNSFPAGYTPKTVKICFSEEEVLEWLNKKYARCKTVDEVFAWWWSYCKPEYKNVHGGLWYEYLKRHKQRRPLIMYKEMAVDEKQHKIY